MEFGESSSPSGKTTVIWTATGHDATVTFRQNESSLEAVRELVTAMRTFADGYLESELLRRLGGSSLPPDSTPG